MLNFLLSVLRRKKMSTRRNILKHFDSKISMYFILTCLIDLSSISGHLRPELDFSVVVHCLVMLWFWSLTHLFFHGKQSDHTVLPLMIPPSHRCYFGKCWPSGTPAKSKVRACSCVSKWHDKLKLIRLEIKDIEHRLQN